MLDCNTEEKETKQDEEEERDCKLIDVVLLLLSTIRLVLTAIQQYASETFLLRSCAFCEGDGLAVVTPRGGIDAGSYLIFCG